MNYFRLPRPVCRLLPFMTPLMKVIDIPNLINTLLLGTSVFSSATVPATNCVTLSTFHYILKAFKGLCQIRAKPQLAAHIHSQIQEFYHTESPFFIVWKLEL